MYSRLSFFFHLQEKFQIVIHGENKPQNSNTFLWKNKNL